LKVPRPGDNEGTFSASNQAATCYYQSKFKGRGNPVKCFAQGHKKQTCRPIFTLSLLFAERQAGKL